MRKTKYTAAPVILFALFIVYLINSLMIAVASIGFVAFNNYKFLLPVPDNIPGLTEMLNHFSESFAADQRFHAPSSTSAAAGESEISLVGEIGGEITVSAYDTMSWDFSC